MNHAVDWPALRAALALRRFQAAYAHAGLMRREPDDEQRRAWREIEEAKAADVAALVEAWEQRRVQEVTR